jgi:hypothetical protein
MPTGSTDDVAQATGPPNLDQLTLQLHHWIGANQRLPKNFEEFAAGLPNQIPPPGGKKVCPQLQLADNIGRWLTHDV